MNKKVNFKKKLLAFGLAVSVGFTGIIPLSSAVAMASENTGEPAISQVQPKKGYEPDGGNGEYTPSPLPSSVPLPSASGNRTYAITENEAMPSSKVKANSSSKSKTTYARVTCSALYMRKGPGQEYASVALLSQNTKVKYLGQTTDKKGDVWFKIQYDGKTGYSFAAYLEVIKEYEPSGDFEKMLNQEGFPASYKPALRQLHAMYPNWHFIGDHTGLAWDSVIKKETNPVSINLVSYIRNESWRSVEPGAYNPMNNSYISYDSGGWIPADLKVIKYFIDPRNFLDSRGIFQFMSNKYDRATGTVSNVAGVTAGTFMKGNFPEKVNGKKVTYNQVIRDIGEKTGVNPMVIASMIIQEQGANGGGRSISGTVSGYKGYYNHFNIGAYAASGVSAVENGLAYAKRQGWNSRYKSILGGAQWFANNYVNNNKYTQYLKKFNVKNGLEMVGRGQYMTNIEGGYDEGVKLSNGYSSLMHQPLTFTIPIYHSMPKNKCELPTSSKNHINFFKSLTFQGVNHDGKVSPKVLPLSKKFDPREQEYSLHVPDNYTKVHVGYSLSYGGSKVSIPGVDKHGNVSVPVGSKTIKIKVTAPSSRYRYYTIHFKRDGGADVKPVPKPDPPKPKPDTKPDPKPNPPKPKPDTKPDPKPDNKPDSSTAPKADKKLFKIRGLKLRTDYGIIRVTYEKSNIKNLSGYRIAYREILSLGDKPEYGPCKYVTVKSTDHLLKGLKFSGFYGIRVAAVNGNANTRSYYTEERKVYANRSGIKHALPYASKITQLSRGTAGPDKNDGTAKITCKAITYKTEPNKVKYRYYYRIKGTSSWHYVTSSSNVRTIKGLTRGKTYTFAVAQVYTSTVDNKTVIVTKRMSEKDLKI